VTEPDSVLLETFGHLEMPRSELANWFRKSIDAYCAGHGGRKYYSELLDLYEECLRLLKKE